MATQNNRTGEWSEALTKKPPTLKAQKKGAGLAVVEPQARSSQADLQTEGWQPNSQKDQSSVGWGGGKSSPNPRRWSKEQNKQTNKNNYNNEKENYF